MTKDQFKARIQEMLAHDGGIADVIYNAAMSVVSSEYGRNQFLNAAEDNFIFPKQVLCAVFNELVFQYEPIERQDKKLVDLLKPLVKVTYKYTPDAPELPMVKPAISEKDHLFIIDQMSNALEHMDDEEMIKWLSEQTDLSAEMVTFLVNGEADNFRTNPTYELDHTKYYSVQ
jgi:hypothetical protein